MLVYASHAVTIQRPANIDRDSIGYGTTDPGPTPVATGVPGSLIKPRAEAPAFGAQADEWVLLVNPDVDLRRFDLVTDEASGIRYEVASVTARDADGPIGALNHLRAELTVSAL